MDRRLEQKILFLCLDAFRQTGGIQKVCRSLGMALFEILNAGNLKMNVLYDHPEDLNNKYIPRHCYKAFGNCKLTFLVQSLFDARKSKIIILSHINLLPLARIMKVFDPSKKIILIAHGIEVWRKSDTRKSKFVQQHLEIWAVSRYTAELTSKIFGLEKGKIRILNNCLDPFQTLSKSFDKPEKLLNRYALKASQPVLLTITRLSAFEHDKGYDFVIKCLPDLLKSNPDLKYLIAGPCCAEERTRIENLIKSLGLENYVLLLGFVPEEELFLHYQLSDVFILPSRKEGFGLVFVEAAVCGPKIIAGNQDGSSDALLDGKLGTLIDPGSAQEIKQSILYNLQNLNDDKSALKQQELALEVFHFKHYKTKIKVLIDQVAA